MERPWRPWNDRGDERTLAGQINEELAPHGLEFIKAKNDRAGGAQLIYTMLQNYQLKMLLPNPWNICSCVNKCSTVMVHTDVERSATNVSQWQVLALREIGRAGCAGRPQVPARPKPAWRHRPA
jgi:hypothetical protein